MTNPGDTRPCPFCGHEGPHASAAPLGKYCIRCYSCAAVGPLAPTVDAAIAAWNTRAGIVLSAPTPKSRPHFSSTFLYDAIWAIRQGTKVQCREPILFDPDVMAQIEPSDGFDIVKDGSLRWGCPGDYELVHWSNDHAETVALPGPLIRKGDTIWVREEWRIEKRGDDYFVDYRADPGSPQLVLAQHNYWIPRDGWNAALTMPEWASRLALVVDDIRPEHLQEITEYEAQKQGTKPMTWVNHPEQKAYIVMFRVGWDKLHPDHPWDDNPWVWVIDFHLEETTDG